MALLKMCKESKAVLNPATVLQLRCLPFSGSHETLGIAGSVHKASMRGATAQVQGSVPLLPPHPWSFASSVASSCQAG